MCSRQIRPLAQGQQPRPLDFAGQQEKINAWTVGLATGLIEGGPIRLASEMARVVDDGANLHVLPIVTRGPTENVNSLLYLRGVDLVLCCAVGLGASVAVLIGQSRLTPDKHSVVEVVVGGAIGVGGAAGFAGLAGRAPPAIPIWQIVAAGLGI